MRASVLPTSAASSGRPAWLPYALVVLAISLLVVSLASLALWQERQRYRELGGMGKNRNGRMPINRKMDGETYPKSVLWLDSMR